MDTMPSPMKLNPETRVALNAIRHSDEPSPAGFRAGYPAGCCG